MRKIIIEGNKAVVISRNPDGGTFCANLYVNVRQGIKNADITSQSWRGKTLAGADSWAKQVLNQK